MDISSKMDRRARVLTAAVVAALTLIGALALPRPASAQALLGDDADPPGLDCLAQAHGSLGATAGIVAGQQATLSWSIQAPSTCGAMRVLVDNFTVGRTGSMNVAAIKRTSAVYEPRYAPGSGEIVTPGFLRSHYVLRVAFGGATRTIDTANVDVRLPVDAATGRPEVTITANHEVPLLLLGLKSRRASVFVQNDVELDLTGYEHIYIASGVQLIGSRSSRAAGPLIYVRCTAWEPAPIPYCSSAPNALFQIHGDVAGTVRITGLRIRGVDADNIAAENATNSHGIVITSALNVEIDNNEISGWRSSAIQVMDNLFPPRICHMEGASDCSQRNSSTIRIHGNYIHHNQQNGTDGYGVAVVKGAYALIEKNVFDYNRHAIATDGSTGSGYLAYRNLVLEHGGFHENVGITIYTHQFDIHGTRDCDAFLWIDGHHNCGEGGEYTEIHFNSFFYERDNAFKLRGTPSVGVSVVSNVFAHEFLTGFQPALGGYVENISTSGNRLGINENGNYGRCDFDRDGLDDEFLATGQTWWFRSGGRHWVYLNTSPARLSEITLGDVDRDGRCDVVANGVVSSGGTGRATPRVADLVWKATTGSLAMWEMRGGTVEAQTALGTIPTTWQLAGLADLRGDGQHSLVWRDESGLVSVWQLEGGVKVAEARAQAAGYTLQGSGDFDADGGDDLLWRDAAGQLVIWFNGRRPLRVAVPAELDWVVRGVGDFDGDGRADILWRHGSNALRIWHMIGATPVSAHSLTAPSGDIQGVADFDADGVDDILWRDTWGGLMIWFAADAGRTDALAPGASVVYLGDPSWSLVDLRDFNGDGQADILWQEETGRLVVWILQAGRFVREEYPRVPPRTWRLASRLRSRDAGNQTGGVDSDDPNDELPVDCGRRCP
ncbi:MAG: FG-GAP-like repeat-containing protein [Vicinamibacterales bacterium]